ncbi:MAG: YajQ family cyclic di-GMP-binding protein [Chloroflexota bacterium]
MADSSFDVVSQYDRQELVNAIDQSLREVRTRFDLKDTGSEISLEKDSIAMASASEFTLQQMKDLFLTKVVRRELSPKIFDWGKVEEASRGTVRQQVKLRAGIDQDLARKIVKLIRDNQPKLKATIQGDAVRVSGASKDALQAAIKLLREQDYPVPLQFVNYR